MDDWLVLGFFVGAAGAAFVLEEWLRRRERTQGWRR